MTWTDEDERQRRAWNRKMSDTGFTPYLSMLRCRRAAWVFAIMASVEFVAIWAIVSNWMLACK